MVVNRSDLINQLAEKYNYTKKAAAMLIDDFANIIVDNLREGNTVSIYNFGTFAPHERKARSTISMLNNERIEIPAHYVPKFTAFKAVKDAVKEWEEIYKRGYN